MYGHDSDCEIVEDKVIKSIRYVFQFEVEKSHVSSIPILQLRPNTRNIPRQNNSQRTFQEIWKNHKIYFAS